MDSLTDANSPYWEGTLACVYTVCDDVHYYNFILLMAIHRGKQKVSKTFSKLKNRTKKWIIERVRDVYVHSKHTYMYISSQVVNIVDKHPLHLNNIY